MEAPVALVAKAFGYGIEVPVFALSGRALRSFGSEQVQPPVGQELASAAITIGALKLSGAGSHALLRRSLGQRPAPILRMLSAQGGMFAGLLAAHRTETDLGLRPHVEGATEATDILSSMLSLGLGMSLGHRALGPSYAVKMKGLALQMRQNDSPLRLPPALSPKLLAAGLMASPSLESLAAPMMMSPMEGGEGKGKSPTLNPITDRRLLDFEQDLSKIRDQDPDGVEVRKHFAVIADRLLEMGDSRGQWMALELNADSSQSESLKAELSRIREALGTELMERFGPGLKYSFDVQRGFRLRVNNPRKVTNRDLDGWLSSGLDFLLGELWVETDFRNFGDLNVLLKKHALPNLRDLTLDHYDLDSDPDDCPNFGNWLASDIAKSANLRELQSLSLRNASIGDWGAGHLARSENMRNLEWLDLSYNRIDDEGVRSIADSPLFGKLRDLRLSDNIFRSQGALYLAQSQNLKALENLDLSIKDPLYLDYGIGDAGALAIAGSRSLRRLKRINVLLNSISAEGYLALIDSEHMPDLVVEGYQIRR